MNCIPNALSETSRPGRGPQLDWPGTLPDAALDELTALAARLCDAPLALITQGDGGHPLFTSQFGWPAATVAREFVLGTCIFNQPDFLIVPDTALDPRFAGHPLVAGAQPIRFFAGARLLPVAGQAAGTLWVADRVPRQLEPWQQEALRVLSRQVMAQLELRRHTSGQLRAAELLLGVFHRIPIPMTFTRLADGMFLDANESFLHMVGYAREEVIGRTALELQFYPDPGRRTLIVEQLSQQGYVHGQEEFLRTKSGQILSQMLWLEKMVLGGEECLLAVSLDVTERRRAEQLQKQLEAQLRQSQKLDSLGTLAGGIAHDFNNILGAIISFAEVARMDNPDNAELQVNLGEVLKASRRATHLVGQILSFSRQQTVERKPLQLAPVVKEAGKLLRATLPASIDLRLTAAENLPDVLADLNQIHQVIVNLCTNAGQAMQGRQGRLSLVLQAATWPEAGGKLNPELPAGNYVRLTVSDTGQGMDAATVERSFDPFFTTQPPGQGTGLGLSVVHGIIKEHGGVIAVESQPGSGTTVTIYLPALPAAELCEMATCPAVPPGARQRVLFVDDEVPLAEVARKMIELMGYQPRVFSEAAAAWQAVQTAPEAFDLLITDLAMPGMTGLELAQNVLRLRPDLPVILMTGNSGSLTLAEVQALGIRQLLSKPLNFQMLALAISTVLVTPAGSPS